MSISRAKGLMTQVIDYVDVISFYVLYIVSYAVWGYKSCGLTEVSRRIKFRCFADFNFGWKNWCARWSFKYYILLYRDWFGRYSVRWTEKMLKKAGMLKVNYPTLFFRAVWGKIRKSTFGIIGDGLKVQDGHLQGCQKFYRLNQISRSLVFALISVHNWTAS